MRYDQIAQVAYEAARAYTKTIAKSGHPAWDKAARSNTDQAVNDVVILATQPSAGPQTLHKAWLAAKQGAGWQVGSTRDDVAKPEPLLVPFEELPTWRRMKAQVFCVVARTLLGQVAVAAEHVPAVHAATTSPQQDAPIEPVPAAVMVAAPDTAADANPHANGDSLQTTEDMAVSTM